MYNLHNRQRKLLKKIHFMRTLKKTQQISQNE